MISVTLKYEDDGDSELCVWQEDGPHWAVGTVVDALLKHQDGSRRLRSIVVDPNAEHRTWPLAPGVEPE